MKIVFDEKSGQYVLDVTGEQGKAITAEQLAAMKQDEAHMEAGGLAASIEKFGSAQVLGLPLGQVILGTAGAFVVDKVIIDRLVARESDPQKAASTAMLGDLVAALVIAKFGPKYLGKSTAHAAAFVLTYEAISGKIATYLDKVWPKSSAQQEQLNRPDYESSIFEQAQAVAAQAMRSGSMANTGGDAGVYTSAF